MQSVLALFVAVLIICYLALQLLLHTTQNDAEPCLLESRFPFFDSAIGAFKHKAGYFAYLRAKFNANIHTLRMPFQRLYIVHTPELVQVIQSKANAATFVPNLLDFGMLFSGLHKQSRTVLGKGFKAEGNSFTLGVHKYLLSGDSLEQATKTAVNILSASVPNRFESKADIGLLAFVKHDLAMAFTGAIYGPESPYGDPDIEQSWNDFVPGINHLLYSPLPWMTARKALRARSRVIAAFQKYFETDGHLQAFAMIPEMYDTNIKLGLSRKEAAKMEMATSLAMLSSGANTTFWFLLHLISDAVALVEIRHELNNIAEDDLASKIPRRKILNLNRLKSECPTLMAMLNETLRFHSSVINIKEVQHDTRLADQYLLKKNGIVMIPGQSIHHNTDIWGPDATVFNHRRFLQGDFKKRLGSTAAFRPFGAGATMCPGRHFSTNVILSFAAMTILQYNIHPVGNQSTSPSKRNADLWNAMPKPDWDVQVRFENCAVEGGMEWKFSWGEEA